MDQSKRTNISNENRISFYCQEILRGVGRGAESTRLRQRALGENF
jgi:hypothetical protein